jgi:DNA-binding transcriptional LysR family regulator
MITVRVSVMAAASRGRWPAPRPFRAGAGPIRHTIVRVLDRRLTYFLAVAREGSFSRAADVLHVAQPALSRQVAQLEAELGVRLLERGPAGVTVTDAGALLLERGAELERDAGALADAVRGFGDGRRGRVVLGYSTSVGYGTAPAVIAALRAALPDADVAPLLLPTPELAGAVVRGPLDLALVRCAEPPPGGGVAAVVVRREALGVLMAPEHPLTRRTDAALTLSDLRELPLSLHERSANPAHHDLLVGACVAAGFTPRVVPPATPFDPAYGALADGETVTLAGESAREAVPGGLVWRPLHGAPRVDISLLTRAGDVAPLARRAAEVVTALAAGRGWT